MTDLMKAKYNYAMALKRGLDLKSKEAEEHRELIKSLTK